MKGSAVGCMVSTVSTRTSCQPLRFLCYSHISLWRARTLGGGTQGEKLRNLIVSEAADWQVLMLWLAVHLEALQRSLQGDGSKDKVSEQVEQPATQRSTLNC